MSCATYERSIIQSLLTTRSWFNQQTAQLIIAVILVIAGLSPQKAVAEQHQASASMAGPLNRANSGGTHLHIFYVHGMGIDAPNARTQDFEASKKFRTNLCKQIGCQKNEFEKRDYANVGHFAAAAEVPKLEYFGQNLWTGDDWHAAAPFVDHYKLVRKNGTVIYVHEINWWPLILSAKCRQIVAKEAALVQKDHKHLETCSAKTIADRDHEGRFTSYAWINNSDIQARDHSWARPAILNRWLKHDILDWGFADALLAVGPLHSYLLEGIRELVLSSFAPADNQEFVIVSHSLGSYLMFSALDLQSPPNAAMAEWQNKFEKMLSQTSHFYFMANQVRLLELANLDTAQQGNLSTHLEYWAHIRHANGKDRPQIVAWSDPDDLLTWQVPDLVETNVKDTTGESVVVDNYPVKNAWRWFWLLANPEAAHLNYDDNKKVIRAMVPKSSLQSSE